MADDLPIDHMEDAQSGMTELSQVRAASSDTMHHRSAVQDLLIDRYTRIRESSAPDRYDLPPHGGPALGTHEVGEILGNEPINLG
jgi:hypothetical protein